MAVEAIEAKLVPAIKGIFSLVKAHQTPPELVFCIAGDSKDSCTENGQLDRQLAVWGTATHARCLRSSVSVSQAHMHKEHVNCVFCEVKCGSQAKLERHVDMYHSGSMPEERKTVECT